MGTACIRRYYPKCSTSELSKLVRQQIDEDCHEHGNGGYTGYWGSITDTSIRFIQDIFPSIDDADDWLLENLQKRGPFIAVKAFTGTSFVDKVDSKLQKLTIRLNTCNDAINSMDETILRRVKSAKSEYRCCSKCGSRISIRYLCTVFCPVCNRQRFLYTNTDIKNLQRLTANRNATQQEHDNRQNLVLTRQRAYLKKHAKENWEWIVAANCPE